MMARPTTYKRAMPFAGDYEQCSVRVFHNAEWGQMEARTLGSSMPALM